MSERIAVPATGGAVSARLLVQMLVCSLLWAPAFLLMKRMGADISPLGVTALRDLIGGLIFGTGFAAIGQAVRPRGREWRDWAILGVLQVIIPNTLTVYALLHITTGLAGLIQTATPLVVAVLAPLLFASERMSVGRAVGLGLGFAGVVLLIGPSLAGEGPSSAAGVLAMAGVPVSFALGNLYVRAIPAAQPLRLAYGQLLFSGLGAGLLTLLVDGVEPFAAARPHLGDLVLLALFATALPLALFMHILRKAGPTIGTAVGYLVPLWIIVIGAVALDERLGMVEILGGAVLLAGLGTLAATYRPAGRQP
ncbi:DMT family transporter [Ancylobacter terrae]|uniref:DMT family transporter n=1 Tax=Ancylobacter sp. sgz301288 TaxID=3342077 RepID=UPI00385D151D